MCLLVMGYRIHPNYDLVLAANRDEFYTRPTRPLAYWDNAPHVLAGLDLEAGGTWMGITRQGRWAALTNYRDPTALNPEAPSRGDLVKNFLLGTQAPFSYLEGFQSIALKYNSFNLICGDASTAYYYSNRSGGIRKLEPGLYGLSNHLLDTNWPKVATLKNDMRHLLRAAEQVNPEAALEILKNDAYPPKMDLPDTGVGPEREKLLSPVFIRSEEYGTRSSSLILVGKTGKVEVFERTYPSPAKERANPAEKPETRHFTFNISKNSENNDNKRHTRTTAQ
jgi:uncharacterized protein with NRDE domain